MFVLFETLLVCSFLQNNSKLVSILSRQFCRVHSLIRQDEEL